MLNNTSLTFKGAAALTVANAGKGLAVQMDRGSGVEVKQDWREASVALTRVHATDSFDEIIGVYSSNPGHEDNEVSIEVTGLLVFRVTNTIAKADLGKGLVTSTVAGISEPGADPAKDIARVGFGKIVGGFTENGEHFAIVLAT